jgi:hypothetical protein
VLTIYDSVQLGATALLRVGRRPDASNLAQLAADNTAETAYSLPFVVHVSLG